MTTTIQDFWFSHERFWFPVTAGEKAEADFEIAKLFWNYDLTDESIIGQIIYYDQFSRHFQRAGLLSEEDVTAWRQKSVGLSRAGWSVLTSSDERYTVWSLMPLKHAGAFEEIFEKATPLLREDWPLLRRFYEDTYKKAYTESEVSKKLLVNPLPTVKYSVADISEEHGQLILPRQWDDPHDVPLTDIVCSASEPDHKFVISLSGGVDSMLLCYLYVLHGYDVSAVHIIYGNRAESEAEFSYIADFCDAISVPLVVYRIEWLRRDRNGGNVSREFYERMTRDLRFMVYRLVAGGRPVVLGHIQDDVVENIMTNFVRGDHLEWLGAMTVGDTQMGVKLLRPFLGVKKDEIYRVARLVGLGWLKNTTPSWSNRGKFRQKFHGALVDQYGSGVDDALVTVAEKIAAQSAMIDRLLYRPIFKSWAAEKMELDVSTAVEARLDAAGWHRIFEWICHDRLGVRKPTLAAAGEFVRRVGRLVEDDRIKINMGKGLVFFVAQRGGCFKLSVELS